MQKEKNEMHYKQTNSFPANKQACMQVKYIYLCICLLYLGVEISSSRRAGNRLGPERQQLRHRVIAPDVLNIYRL